MIKNNCIIYVFVSLFIMSCVDNKKTEIEKLKKLVANDIELSIPKYYKYTPILFSSIDSAMSDVSETREFENVMRQIIIIDSTYISDSLMSIDAGIPRTYPLREEKRMMENKLAELENKYHAHYLGKRIYHKYKCSTNFGDSLYVSEYIFDDSNRILKKEIISKGAAK